MLHVFDLIFWEWENMWDKNGDFFLTEDMVNAVFFLKFMCRLQSDTGRRTTTLAKLYVSCTISSILTYVFYRSLSSWPLPFIAERYIFVPFSPEDRYRILNPTSDFLILHAASLPVLFAMVQPEHTCAEWPEDLIQMLLQAAAIVRLANKKLKAYMGKKDFVLPVLYIKINGTASRYSVYEADGSVSFPLLPTKLRR